MRIGMGCSVQAITETQIATGIRSENRFYIQIRFHTYIQRSK